MIACAAIEGKTAVGEAIKDAYQRLKERLFTSARNQAEVERTL